MAISGIEVAEFAESANRSGNIQPLPPLPALNSRRMTLDNTYQLAAKAVAIRVLTDADVRIAVGPSSSLAAVDGQAYPIKAGVEQWFEVYKGWYIRFTAA